MLDAQGQCMPSHRRSILLFRSRRPRSARIHALLDVQVADSRRRPGPQPWRVQQQLHAPHSTIDSGFLDEQLLQPWISRAPLSRSHGPCAVQLSQFTIRRRRYQGAADQTVRTEAGLGTSHRDVALPAGEVSAASRQLRSRPVGRSVEARATYRGR